MIDEDDDIFNEEVEDTGPLIPEEIQKLTDRDLSNELSLPDVLLSLSRQDKQLLLVFKRSHNEIDWEEELLQRQELIARKVDMERLKKMTTKDKSKKSKATIDSDSEDLSDFGGDAVGSDSDDDLFDSDEEREILAKKAKKTSTKKATKKSKLDDMDSDDEFLDGDDVDDEAADAMDVEVKVDTSEPAELIDFHKIQTRREQMEKWIKEPYFKTALEGTFIRLMVGSIDDEITNTKKPVYRMCEIKEVTENASKTPFMPGSKIMTTKRMTVAIGAKEKSRVRFHDVSNSRIKEDEFAQYLLEMDDSSKYTKRLTKDETKSLKSKRDKTVDNHIYTSEQISAMIKTRSGSSKAAHTTHHDALDNLDYEIEKAKEENRLDDLDKLSNERQSELDTRASLQEKMTRGNAGHVKRNKTNDDKRFKKDMNASKKNKAKALASGSDDPFIRRQTHPENLWSVSARTAPMVSNKDARAAEAIKSSGFEASMNGQKKQSVHGNSASSSENVDMSIDAIRLRVKKRMGQDPIAAAAVEPAAKYLKLVCVHYPPKGSREREELRRGVSLAEYINSSDE